MSETQAQKAGRTYHVPGEVNELVLKEAQRTGADPNNIVRYLLKKGVTEMFPLPKEIAEALT